MDTEMALKMRVKTCMEKLKVSANEMERQCGISHSTISSQVNGKSKLSATVIAELLAYRPDISAEWLLRGTGDMLITNKPTEINIDNSSHGHHNTNIGSIGTQTIANSDLAELKQQIAELKADKEKLYQLLLKQ
jgi:transcriptional regulator with XRE-family HTH domain